EFFSQMRRYRIILRHQSPMRLSVFIDECKGRLLAWAGKRILITLNTRRSARIVRDELAKELPEGMAVEFLTADVTPKDRLAAISRIKYTVNNVKSCLVISTQSM